MTEAAIDIEHLKTWIGREATVTDLGTSGPQDRLAALLDHETPPWQAGAVPPLGHWLYFLPDARQSEIGPDGHPRLGGFLPPVPLPRRMWAGSRIEFVGALPLGAEIARRTRIEDVELKTGRSGTMVLLTLRHEILAAGRVAVVEAQDLVYREAAAPGAASGAAPSPAASSPAPSSPAPGNRGPGNRGAGNHGPGKPAAASAPAARRADFSRAIVPDPVLLFRFSALTFNAHRIHYDRDYTRDVEGYPGLLVHGPLLATLLMDLYLRHSDGPPPARFRFRGQKPVFDLAPFTANLAWTETGADLWIADEAGEVAMTAAADIDGS